MTERDENETVRELLKQRDELVKVLREIHDIAQNDYPQGRIARISGEALDSE